MSSIWTIRRSATDVKLTGLCGGVAQHWGVDPVLVRVGWALLALSGGIGVVLYLAGWLLIPVEGKKDAPIHDLLGEQSRKWSREVWLMIVAVCCIAAFAIFGSLTPFGFGPAVILALIWYFGYYKNRRPSRDGAAAPRPPTQPNGPSTAQPQQVQFFTYPGPSTPFTQAAEVWRQRIEENAEVARSFSLATDQPTVPYEESREPIGPASSLPPASPFGPESADYHSFMASPDPVGLYAPQDSVTAATGPAVVSRAHSSSARRLRLVSLVVVGLTLSGLGVADAIGVSIPLAGYFGAALLVLGLTLVAAAWFGRARGILPVALLLMLATLGASVSDPIARDHDWGSQQVAYTSASQLTAGDSRELGQLNVDLSQLKLHSDASYTAHVDLGTLQVTVPKDVNVVVTWRVDAGAFVGYDQASEGGSELNGVLKPSRSDPKTPTLTLNLSVDGGKLQVRR